MKKMYLYYILFIPVLAYFIIFSYAPMYGVTLAFKDFKAIDGIMGSPWVGLKHFTRLFSSSVFWEVVRNTLMINLWRIIFAFPAPVILALLINEVRHNAFKRTVQTISYLPHFISWVILSGIINEVLSPSRGALNYLITVFGGQPIYFLAEVGWFRAILVITGIWQSVGWGTIIYLAAISGIEQEQYESAYIDGANRWHLVKYITVPSIIPVVSIMLILTLGGILNGGFDQVFNLYSPPVFRVGDIIDTYVYRVGLGVTAFGARPPDFSFATAVGLFKNVIGLFLVLGTNFLAGKLNDGEGAIW